MTKDFSQIRHITILGVGLIGGSLGLALKAKGFQGEIVGLGRRLSTLEVAYERGAVSRATTDFEDGLSDAELVVIGTPVDLIPAMAVRIAESVTDESKPMLITDVGSTKGYIVESVERFLLADGHKSLHFVGSHPMAGSDKRGAIEARADLFEATKCIVTPTQNSSPPALQLISDLWQFVGADVHLHTPLEHDIAIAGASHLPHLVASILTNTVGAISNDNTRAWDFVATGFRDTTRIAAGDPEIWRGIFTQNASALTPMIGTLIENLTHFRNSLENEDADEITRILMRAKTLRGSLEE